MSPKFSGILLVDKPQGLTSHDVVGRLRKRLGEKKIGHAGTLDPMATGLIVALIGEGTKLEPYLARADKSYLATVQFGSSTDTLDAEGRVTAEAPLSPALAAELAARAQGPAETPLIAQALAALRSREQQIPPAHSAIHVDGQRSYDLARKGQAVELPPREVKLLEVAIEAASATTLTLSMTVSKGYYVRSFARDLAALLEVPGHLSALRRTRSGAFDVKDAALLEQEALSERMLGLVQAVQLGGLPTLQLDEAGAREIGFGRAIDAPAELGPAEFVALLNPAGGLIAIAELREAKLSVARGFQG
jgi:tRNA pseudouridine55 synthase